MRQVEVTSSQYQLLTEQIRASFQLNDALAVLPIETERDDYRGNDRFFEAKGSYSCFRTCNTWTNDMLKGAGVVNACWAPTPEAVFLHLPANP